VAAGVRSVGDVPLGSKAVGRYEWINVAGSEQCAMQARQRCVDQSSAGASAAGRWRPGG